MNTTIKTALAAILLLAISCKKENSTIQSSRASDQRSIADIITFNNDPGKYTAVRIGKQVWVQQNLAVSRYRNGDKIPHVNDAAQWGALTTGAWCWYNNDSATGTVYGKLYNWYAVNDPRGLAPKGWHIPSRADWDTLSHKVKINGGKLKDTGTIELVPGYGMLRTSVPLIRVASQGYRVAIVRTLEYFIASAPPATGGLLRHTLFTKPGASACFHTVPQFS